MNVNEKGVKGLIKVIDDLQEQGYYVYPAFDDHAPVDLVAMDKKGQTYRLQAKYRTRQRCKKAVRYELVAASVVNGKKVPIDKSLIDGWAVYLKEHDKVVYVSVAEFGSRGVKVLTGDEHGRLDEWSKSAPC